MQLEGVLALIRDADDGIFGEVEMIEKEVKGYIEKNDLSNGNVLWPLRVSLSGMERSAGPFEYLWVLGRDEAVMRIEKALKLLG